MEFLQMKDQLIQLFEDKSLINATISQPRLKSNDLKRVKIKPHKITEP